MFQARKDFIFDGKGYKAGDAFDAKGADAARVRVLELTRFIVRAVEKPKRKRIFKKDKP